MDCMQPNLQQPIRDPCRRVGYLLAECLSGIQLMRRSSHLALYFKAALVRRLSSQSVRTDACTMYWRGETCMPPEQH